MPPAVPFYPPQHTQPHHRTHTHRPRVNLTVSRKVSTKASDLLPPFLSPLFLLLCLGLCKWSIRLSRPSFLPFLPLFHLIVINTSSSFSTHLSQPGFTSLSASSNLFVHLSTLTRNLSLPPFSPYRLPSPSPQMRIYPLPFPSFSSIFLQNPNPLLNHTHIHTPDCGPLTPPATFDKSLKDPQMCAPLISISKKKTPPSLRHSSNHACTSSHTQQTHQKHCFTLHNHTLSARTLFSCFDRDNKMLTDITYQIR